METQRSRVTPPRSHSQREQGFEFLGLVGIPSVHAKSVQLCPTLCDPLDCSLPGSSVHGILQARTLEWSAMPSSRGSS